MGTGIHSVRRAGRASEPPFALVAAVIGVLAATRFFAIAASPGEIDEAVFAGAVTRFDLFDLSPQAPGFPLWILIGRALLPVCVQPFTALAVASTLLAACALPALYAWGRRLVGGWAALTGTLFSASLPVVFVNGGRAFTDTPATAFFLFALAFLVAAEEAPSPRGTYLEVRASGRKARLYAIAAGLSAAAGVGIRPHLVLAFGPVLALGVWRLARRGDRHDAAVSTVLAGAAGTSAWLAWLLAQAGGVAGLAASLSERAGFRAHAFATGHFGGFADSFLVRDALSPRRAILLVILSLLGLAWLASRGRRAALAPLLLILVPTLWSLWFLHSRAVSRYSVPFALVAALLVGAGIEALARKGPLVLLGGAALAASYFVHSWPEARWGARNETPPMRAIAALERYVHAGRQTIVADEIFAAFLRLERWEGRLVAWGYLDPELVSGARQANLRWVRLSDFTTEVDPSAARDPAWRAFSHEGRVAERLSNGRLLAIALRDPAPPLFGPSFGVKETIPGKPSFRWAGPGAQLIVPGLSGPPVVFLSGRRDGPPTTLTVTDRDSGAPLLTRVVPEGPFELVVASPPVRGPLARPRTLVLSCDRPRPLEPVSWAKRPAQGCVLVDEATYSMPAESLWAPRLDGRVLDLGAEGDRQGDPRGFWARERVDAKEAKEARDAPGLDMRWTAERASVLYVPDPDVLPARLVLRCRPPFAEAVAVRVTVGAVLAGTLVVPPGDFAERRLELPAAAVAALHGRDPVRIELAMPAVAPKSLGKGEDTRPLGIGLDWIALE